MSIKIYDGMRVQVSDIDKFIKIFDKRCLSWLEYQTKELMVAIKHERLLESAEKAKGLRGDLTPEQLLEMPEAEAYLRFLEVSIIYIEAMKSNYNFYNPTCWFNAFVYRDYFYIVPGYPTGLRSPKFPKYVEEFGYWNNTDSPNGVSDKEFNKRGELWKKSGALNIPFNNRLSHELIQNDNNCGSLIRIENKVLSDGKINGQRRFPASYSAWYRLEKEQNEHNRNQNRST